MSNDTPPTLHYWRIWTDTDGNSHQTRCAFTDFESQSMGGAAPQWNLPHADDQAKIMFSVLPANWTGDWHENPEPQWIVPLSGRWFVESMDGTRVEFGPGEASFGGDQHCRADTDGRKGHRSGTLEGKPVFLMLVQLAHTPFPEPPRATD